MLWIETLWIEMFMGEGIELWIPDILDVRVLNCGFKMFKT
jgi:hypothetical protein